MKKVLFVDMDDVLAELISTWISFLNNEHNLELRLEDIRNWDIHKSINMAGINLTLEQVWEPFNHPNFFLDLPKTPGAIEGIEELRNYFRPVILTAVPLYNENFGRIAAEKIAWLRKHIPWIVESRDIVMTYKKELALGFLLIDDAPHNIESFSGNAICFDRPWNTNLELGLDINSRHRKRGYDWQQITQICKEMLVE